MGWFVFPGGEADYLAWHGDVCTAEGIPHPGRTQHDDAVALADTWTDSYAGAWQLTDGRLVVNLDGDDPYAAFLTPTVVDVGDGLGDRGDLDGATQVIDRRAIPDVWDGAAVTPVRR